MKSVQYESKKSCPFVFSIFLTWLLVYRVVMKCSKYSHFVYITWFVSDHEHWRKPYMNPKILISTFGNLFDLVIFAQFRSIDQKVMYLSGLFGIFSILPRFWIRFLIELGSRFDLYICESRIMTNTLLGNVFFIVIRPLRTPPPRA